jgi:beta-glucosidase
LGEAKAAARQAEVALVFVGLPSVYEAEGSDRQHLDLPQAYNALVDAVLDVQPNTVVVLINGSAVAMPWAARVPAILEGWLTGQAGGGAVADVLLGRVNPSGKLSETFPMRLADTPAYLDFPATGRSARYSEGLFTGYRWVDARQIEPLFPFGHGLSYTTFAYSDLAVDITRWHVDGTVEVKLTVRNTGVRAGQEVVQLYVGDRTPGRRGPVKELRAFAKIDLQPSAAQTVRFDLTGRDFATFDELGSAWTIPGGEYDILVGASSREIRLQQCVQLTATHTLPPVLDSYSTIREWIKHPLGKAMLAPLLDEQLRLRTGGAPVDEVTAHMLEGFILDMPLMKLATRGVLPRATIDQLIAAAKGEPG